MRLVAGVAAAALRRRRSPARSSWPVRIWSFNAASRSHRARRSASSAGGAGGRDGATAPAHLHDLGAEITSNLHISTLSGCELLELDMQSEHVYMVGQETSLERFAAMTPLTE